ncbi:MAG: ester cyclase [Negativibacillus sp.]|nr:ester cyclase [Negativibacillus sp.]
MDNQELIRHFYEVVFSNQLLDELPELVAEDCVLREGEELIPTGIDGMRQNLLWMRQFCPDCRMRVIRQYSDGDTVISECVMEGTHLDDWMGIPPSGKHLRFNSINIDRIENGKIVEHCGIINTFETLLAHRLIQPA